MSALQDAQLRVVAAAKRIYPEYGDLPIEIADIEELEAAVASLRRVERGDEQEIAYRDTVRDWGYGMPGYER